MNLHDYLSSQPITQTELAKSLGISPVLVHQWKNGVRQVPAERCPEIEKATGGVVRCEDLRPDVDWGYLRGTSQTASDPTPTADPDSGSPLSRLEPAQGVA